MNSFWGNLYDHDKDRRYAALFLVMVVTFSGLAMVGVILYLRTRALERPEDVVALLIGVGVFITALVWRAIRRFRAQRRGRPAFSPLSRDELTKARSKLLKDRNFKKYERGLHFDSGGDCGMAGVQRGSGGGRDLARLSGGQRSRQ